MAIDARIPLGVQSSNIGDLVMNFADKMNNQKRAEKHDARLDRQSDLQEKQLEAAAQAAQQKRAEAAQKRSQADALRLTARLSATKDPDARLRLLQGHRTRLQQRIDAGEPINTQHTDQMLEQLSSNPEAFEANLQGEIAAARMLGDVAAAPETFTTKMVNGMPVQVSSKSNRAYDMPGVESSTDRRLADLAISQRQASIAAAQDRRTAAQTAAEQRKFELDQAKAKAEREKLKRKQDADKAKIAAKNAYQAAVEQEQVISEDIAKAIELATWKNTGMVGGVLKEFGGTEAAALASLLETISGNSALSEIVRLGEAGVKLTPITDADIRLLANTRGGLNVSLPADILVRNLGRHLKAYQRVIPKARESMGQTNAMTDEQRVLESGGQTGDGGLSAAEQAELKQLREEFGRGKP